MRGVLGNNDTTEGRTDTELKSDGFLLLLGSSFKEDKYALVNQGYPLLFWQTTEDADRVTDVIAKIESIGAVTLGGADKINEARNAYDDLDGELKALVSNLQALKQAEELLASMQSLQQAKEGAAKQLEAYKNPSDYRAEQQKELKSAVERGMLAIDKAQSAGEVSSALTAAKAVIDGIKTDKQLVDEEAAGIVVSKINAIGAVKLESENMIKDARKAYDALAEDVRTLVDNYDILIRAEAELERLKAASAPQNPSGDNSDFQITPPDTDGNMSVLSVPFAVGVICLGLLIKRRKRSA